LASPGGFAVQTIISRLPSPCSIHCGIEKGSVRSAGSAGEKALPSIASDARQLARLVRKTMALQLCHEALRRHGVIVGDRRIDSGQKSGWTGHRYAPDEMTRKI
jgi:hypothetical protein